MISADREPAVCKQSGPLTMQGLLEKCQQQQTTQSAGSPSDRHPYRAEAGWDRLGVFVPVQESEAAFAFWVGCSQSRTLLPSPYVAWLPVEMPGVIYRFLFSL